MHPQAQLLSSLNQSQRGNLTASKDIHVDTTASVLQLQLCWKRLLDQVSHGQVHLFQYYHPHLPARALPYTRKASSKPPHQHNIIQFCCAV